MKKLLVVAACWLVGLYWITQPLRIDRIFGRFNDPASFATDVHDIDCGPILKNVAAKKTLGQTLDWWGGPWCGEVPFFRPITSMLFWLKYKIFGIERLNLWLVTAIVSHLVTIWLAYLAISRLINSWLVAGFGVLLFASAEIQIKGVFHFGLGHQSETYPFWKNAPEYWESAVVFGSVLAFLCRQYVLALVLTLVGIGVKETGFAIVPVLVLVGWYKKQSAPRWFWIAGTAVTTALFVYRYWALGTLGYHLGSNNSWWFRALLYYGGAIGAEFAQERVADIGFHQLVAGAGTAASIICYQLLARPVRLFVAGLVLGLSWVLAVLVAVPGDSELAITSLVLGNWKLVLIIFDVLLVAAAVYHYPRQSLLLLGIWVIFSAPLFSAAQITRHAFYLADIWRTCLVVMAWLAIVKQLTLTSPVPVRTGDFYLV